MAAMHAACFGQFVETLIDSSNQERIGGLF